MLSLLIATAIASAQDKSLNVARFFTEEIASLPSVTLVRITGDHAKWKDFERYASISVKGDDALADRLAAAVKKDGANAESKETSYRNGRLYFGFYSLGSKNDERRYLFYLDRRPAGGDKTTLIFISGDLSPEDVKKIINNKK